MAYALGVDLGTTYSAAAVAVDERVDILQLGTRTATMPSVVVLRENGEVLVGEPAERRATTEPTRTAREFKRRLGDPTPMILGGTPYGSEALTGILLRHIVERATQEMSEPPALTVLTHPASYGAYKIDLLEQAGRLADLSELTLLPEPEAAALHYLGQERIAPGEAVAVYDFGGGTFDVAVLRRTADGFEQLGEPEGMERLGGIDFDEAVFQHVSRVIEVSLDELDLSEETTRAALARLRTECQLAKEALSEDTDATIPVSLPGIQRDVRITRSEFEEMIRPRVFETLATLERAVRSAGLSYSELSRILLVGGSSRIPLVAEMVREETGRPVALDTHPKHTIALGAAEWAQSRLVSAGTAAPPPPPAVTAAAAVDNQARSASGGAPAPVIPVEQAAPLTGSRSPQRSSTFLIATGIAAVLVALLGGFFLFGPGSGGDNDAPAAAATETTDPTPDTSPTATTLAAEPTTATSEPTTEVTPTVTATAPPTATVVVAPTQVATVATDSARILNIEASGGAYVVDFETTGFVPTVPGQHVHFFFDTVLPADAGVPGAGPWYLYGGPSPFTGFTAADRPAGASEMCILVANADHSVQQDTGNCWALP